MRQRVQEREEKVLEARKFIIYFKRIKIANLFIKYWAILDFMDNLIVIKFTIH